MKKPAQVKMITADNINRSLDFDELKGMVCQIKTMLNELESEMKTSKSSLEKSRFNIRMGS